MKISKCYCFSLWGLQALPVVVEIDIHASDDPKLIIVGLPDSAVRESKDRVLAALKNSGFPLGSYRCTVNLAPGNLKKEGPLYDLPIALGILCATGKIPPNSLDNLYIAGELSLSGEVRPIAGALPFAMLADKNQAKGIFLPAINGKEGALVKTPIYLIESLQQAAKYLRNEIQLQPIERITLENEFETLKAPINFSDVKGQATAKRALEIAAAGGHNIVLNGPPGSGKSMLAKALIGILPPLSMNEAMETTQIHSAAKLLKDNSHIVKQRPFRSPHHSVSYAGLIGGGNIPKPGEVSLAHNGILFLDELPEFNRSVLEVLRQPLEDRTVTVSRANGSVTYPCRFICVAAMNPCPCGFTGHPTKACKDTLHQIQRYVGKISGPLWDRMDLHVQVPTVSYDEMHGTHHEESSDAVLQRVLAARARQELRLGKGRTNSSMSRQEMQEYIKLDDDCHSMLKDAMEMMGLSARRIDRLLRVGLTIADLEDRPFSSDHLAEALSYKIMDTRAES